MHSFYYVCIFGKSYAYNIVLHADFYARAAQRLGFRLVLLEEWASEANWGAELRQADLESATQSDRLAEAIVESVLSGEFPPGLRLDEGMLADRYGVSRTPVREALRQLASTGLIELKPRRGATVATATSAQLEALFGAMAEIEATCARLAAMSMTPIERRRLQTHAGHDGVDRAERRPRRLCRRERRLSHPDLSGRAQRDPVRLRGRSAAEAGAVPARAIPHRGTNLALERRARGGRQGHPRLRPVGGARGDDPSHEPRRGTRSASSARPRWRRRESGEFLLPLSREKVAPGVSKTPVFRRAIAPDEGRRSSRRPSAPTLSRKGGRGGKFALFRRPEPRLERRA